MNKNLLLALICIGLIAVITLASGSNYGFDVSGKPVASLEQDQVFSAETGPVIPAKIAVYTLTVSNSFIPRSYPLPEFEGCFYNSKTGQGQYASISADVSDRRDFSRFGSVEVGVGETKSVKFYLDTMPRGKESEFDLLLLIEEGECYDLLPSEVESAVKIPLI
ncbi:hypothetical protein KY329_03495 [Candidatus Woesearchaeota archaeon]|nr:hypothetical protein [Candidatus Woesearchaeota archaeon]